jgi:hypothetical protein
LELLHTQPPLTQWVFEGHYKRFQASVYKLSWVINAMPCKMPPVMGVLRTAYRFTTLATIGIVRHNVFTNPVAKPSCPVGAHWTAVIARAFAFGCWRRACFAWMPEVCSTPLRTWAVTRITISLGKSTADWWNRGYLTVSGVVVMGTYRRPVWSKAEIWTCWQLVHYYWICDVWIVEVFSIIKQVESEWEQGE